MHEVIPNQMAECDNIKTKSRTLAQMQARRRLPMSLNWLENKRASIYRSTDEDEYSYAFELAGLFEFLKEELIRKRSARYETENDRIKDISEHETRLQWISDFFHYKHDGFEPDHTAKVNGTGVVVNSKVNLVYASYAWGGEGAKLVDSIRTVLPNGIALKIDKDNSAGTSISAFMRELGQADLVLVAIDSKYLRSLNCMTELKHLHDYSLQHKETFQRRVIPLVVGDIRFDSAHERLPIIKEWKEQYKLLEEALNKAGVSNIGKKDGEDLKLMQAILNNISDILSWLSDILMPRGDDLLKNNCAELVNVLESRFEVLSNREADEDLRPDDVRVVLSELGYELICWALKSSHCGFPLDYLDKNEVKENFPSCSDDDILDAVLELEDIGLIERSKTLGGWYMRATSEAYDQLDQQVMGFDTAADTKSVVEVILNNRVGNADKLRNQLGWDLRRFNPALNRVVELLPDRAISKTIQPNYVTHSIALDDEVLVRLRRYRKFS